MDNLMFGRYRLMFYKISLVSVLVLVKIFRQICKISLIHMACPFLCRVCVCVCVCVCASVTFVDTGHTLDKIKKILKFVIEWHHSEKTTM